MKVKKYTNTVLSKELNVTSDTVKSWVSPSKFKQPSIENIEKIRLLFNLTFDELILKDLASQESFKEN